MFVCSRTVISSVKNHKTYFDKIHSKYVFEAMYMHERIFVYTFEKPPLRQTKQNQFKLCAKINGSISFVKISVEIGLYDLVYKSSPENALNQAS